MERTPFTSEVVDDDDDSQESLPVKPRSPLEVMRDWWEDRQRMVAEREHDHEEDEEDDDSPEGRKKRRIGKVLRGFFGSNVEKHEVTHDSAPAVTPERSFIGAVVEVEETTSPDIEPDVATEAEPEEVELDDDSEEELDESEPDAPEATPEDDDEDEDTTVTTRTLYAGATPVIPAAGAGAGGGGVAGGAIPTPPSPPAGGVVPVPSPPVGGGAPGGPPTGGGNVIHTQTIIERQPVIEQHDHHHRRAALAALILAERIDHHRNEKRKDQIAKVEKSQEKVNEQSEVRMSHLEEAARKRKLEEARTPVESTTAVRRPEQKPVPRQETVRPNPEFRTIDRPQSVKEVLETKQIQREQMPNLADLQHKPQKAELSSFESDDIIAAAEKLANQAELKDIAHEVYDERWHEVKDPKAAGTRTNVQRDDQLPTPMATASVAQSQYSVNGGQQQPRQATATTQDDTNRPSLNGLWAALIVGVIAGIVLIAMAAL
jgi:hypothetical protein